MTTQTQQIYRRANGAIDIDHYRNRALMERRAAMTSAGRRVNFSALRLVAAAVVIGALIALPTRGSVPTANDAPAAVKVALEAR